MNIKIPIITVCFLLSCVLIAIFIGDNNQPESSLVQERFLSKKLGDVDEILTLKVSSQAQGHVPQIANELSVQTTINEEPVVSKETAATHISENDTYSSPADNLANALGRMKVIPDIHKKFNSDPVNEEWSVATEENFYQFFSNEKAINAGVMFDSIECRSTMCQSKIVNTDSNKNRVDADPMMRLFYESEWGRNFVAQTQAPDPDTGEVAIFFIKTP